MTSIAEYHDVVVIGAGISGLKAAIDLNRSGIDTIILEARDRLGGRLYTEKLDGVNIDIGASWFHDCLTNPLFLKNLKNPNVKYYFDDAKTVNFTSQGHIDTEELIPIVEELHTYIKLRYSKNPLDDSLHNLINEYLAEKAQFLSKTQIEYAPQLLRLTELWFGSCWDQSSAIGATEMEHEGRNAFVTSGYSSVYETELKEFPLDRILKKKLVQKIERGDKISLYCDDGTKYTCNYIIVTIPMPCLTSDDLSIPGSIEWVPQLPQSLTRQYPKMSFAALGKVAFQFDKITWPLDWDRNLCLADPDQKSIQYMKCTGEPLHHDVFPENGTLKCAPKAWQYPVLFVNVAKFTGKPVIIALIQAPVTHYIEALKSEAEVWEYFEPFFRKFSKGTSSPIKILKTNWTQDPLARGSYMGAKVGSEFEKSIEILQKGLPNVRFAGEHTVVEGNGCAHGAWLSGAREAAYVKSRLHGSRL